MNRWALHPVIQVLRMQMQEDCPRPTWLHWEALLQSTCERWGQQFKYFSLSEPQFPNLSCRLRPPYQTFKETYQAHQKCSKQLMVREKQGQARVCSLHAGGNPQPLPWQAKWFWLELLCTGQGVCQPWPVLLWLTLDIGF